MEACHPHCLKILMDFLGGIVHRSLLRALDVAGGDGRLSAGLLLGPYGKVDLFDQCPVAIKRARHSMGGHESLG